MHCNFALMCFLCFLMQKGIVVIGTCELGDKKSRLKWFRHVEHTDDADFVKQCLTLEIDGTRSRCLW